MTVDDRQGPVAAVDCGSNSTRLLVMGPDGTALERQMRITRLGEGVDTTRTLSSAALERTLSVLRDYRRRMDEHAVTRVRLVATSAARDATNVEEFRAGATEIVGVRPEVLSGEEEGRLSFAGATAHLQPEWAGSGPVLVVDIGGGSTELVVGKPRYIPSTSVTEVAIKSLDIGCVRVSERFLRRDPPPAEDVARARDAVTAQVTAAQAGLPLLAPDSLLIGLAGTVSTLSCLLQGTSEYDRGRVHHSVLTRDDVERWLGILSAEDTAARLARPGMSEGRADVMVGGVLILAVVMEAFDRDRCLVSEDDILDGLAASLMASTASAG
jgi:exopolyphosphatase/guanosine-5'-triphosphate,3'-diphosphate pyrophosphatase